ncbi:hypothetical protein HHI36_000255 [Cryptolaemus montrouzieri]|uniref:Uncharacterized protein n=1 Tax=Cryptolaemus montrouzieri TaxID=559131 RepID=A0ABD2P431_9CUCU
MKKITKGFQPQNVGCRSESGVIITDEKKTMERWASHFKNLLNKQDEMQNALKWLRNNRAPEEDGTFALLNLHKVIHRIVQREINRTLIEVNKEMEEHEKHLGLIVNPMKTVYMKMSPSEDQRKVQDLQKDNVIFKRKSNFTYLGEVVNIERKTSAAISELVHRGNRAYFAHLNSYNAN